MKLDWSERSKINWMWGGLITTAFPICESASGSWRIGITTQIVIAVLATHLTRLAWPKSDKALASLAWTCWPHQITATTLVIADACRCCFKYDSHDDYQKQYFDLQSNKIHSIHKNSWGKTTSNADIPFSPFFKQRRKKKDFRIKLIQT